jgi:hypothetical protein
MSSERLADDPTKCELCPERATQETEDGYDLCDKCFEDMTGVSMAELESLNFDPPRPTGEASPQTPDEKNIAVAEAIYQADHARLLTDLAAASPQTPTCEACGLEERQCDCRYFRAPQTVSPHVHYCEQGLSDPGYVCKGRGFCKCRCGAVNRRMKVDDAWESPSTDSESANLVAHTESLTAGGHSTAHERNLSDHLAVLESENARLRNELAASRLATENYAALWADSPAPSEITDLRRELAAYREVVERIEQHLNAWYDGVSAATTIAEIAATIETRTVEAKRDA